MAKKNMNNGAYVVRLVREPRYVAATNEEGTNAALFFTGANNEGYTTKAGDDAVSYIDFRLNGKRVTRSDEEIKLGDRLKIGQGTYMFVPLCGEHFQWQD